MDLSFSKLIARFRGGTILMKIIYINATLFVGSNLILLFLMLFGIGGGSWMEWFYLPSNLQELLYRPWTVVTYMFFHKDIWHIVMNMLWFYWFGTIFLTHFNERTLGGLYFLGGLFGAIIFLLAYNLFPYFAPFSNSSILLGASASVLAVVVATAMRLPNMEVRMILLGSVKLKWIALAIVAIDLFSITSNNAGGHWAHLGGAFAGYIFSIQWRSGRDITSQFSRLIDRVVNLFDCKPKMKVKYNQARRPESDMDYRERKQREGAEIDQILDKIKKSGYATLSAEEKRKLFEAGNR